MNAPSPLHPARPEDAGSFALRRLGGNIGADYVAKAAPDGNTLLIGAVATHAINPSLYPRMPYDAERDFTPVSLIAVVPNVLVLNAEFAQRESIRSVDDFITVLKRKPGALQFASGGNGSQHHLTMEMLKARAGVDLLHVPYKGGGPATIALFGGEVSVMFGGNSVAPHIRSGKLRAIAAFRPAGASVSPGRST